MISPLHTLLITKHNFIRTKLISQITSSYKKAYIFRNNDIVFFLFIVLRVLGIPTRAISNFNSAHDTDGNCTYDRYYDENGEFLSRISRDSTWLVFVLF